MKRSFQNIIFTTFEREDSNLFTGDFALSMATGIVSIAAALENMHIAAVILFYLNIFFYAILWIMLLLRLVLYTKKFANDFSNDVKGPGFLTIIASTNILGDQFIQFRNDYLTASVLFYLGFFLWIIILYSLFTVLIVKARKPTLEKGINGMWLLVVVATQSVSILLTSLSGYLPFSKEISLFGSLSLFLTGCFLYLIIITLIFYRLIFFKLRARDFTPAYWINMGAVAIVTLAGSALIEKINDWVFLTTVKHFLVGFTLMFWAVGSWWIPLLFVLEIWRHFYKHVPLVYHPRYWGMVFPIGMYTVCTHQFAKLAAIPFLMSIPSVFVYIAFLAWTVTFIGMLHKTHRNFLRKNRMNR